MRGPDLLRGLEETSVQIADALSSSSSSSGTGAASRRATKDKGRGCGSSTWTRGGLVVPRQTAAALVVVVDCASGEDRSRLCRADVRPPWLFSKRTRGSKTLDGNVEVFWDLSGPRIGGGGPELRCTIETVLLLDDMPKDADAGRAPAPAGLPLPSTTR